MVSQVGQAVWRGALLVAVCLFVTGTAQARPVAPPSCFNDSDCPQPECGGLVCDWNQLAPLAPEDKPYLCVSAGLGPPGNEGWCTAHADCKCRGSGAECRGVYCSFTQPPAMSGGGASAVGGAAAAGGASAAGAFAGGASTGGSSGTSPPRGMGPDDTPARTSQACSLGQTNASAYSFPLFFGLFAALLFTLRRSFRPIPD